MSSFFFVPMCQIFWHMGTGQRAVPLEPALCHPLFFLTFSLSAQCVRNFFKLFFQKKKINKNSLILRLFPVTWGLNLQS